MFWFFYMEKEKKSIDSETKFSWKIKWILATLLLVLWSSNFSYSQESDILKKGDKLKLDSYVEFKENELKRVLDLNDRNNVFQMTWQLLHNDKRFWFHEFDSIWKEITEILDEIEIKDGCLSLLDDFQKQIEFEILREQNAECRLALTYIVSKIKDRKDKINGTDVEQSELLKKNLKIWDVLLINKKVKIADIGSQALKFYDEKYLTDFTHVLIFIWFDEKWNIMVRHSTTETEKFHKIWVEETTLESYLFDSDRCDAKCCDILVLRPIPEIRQSILDFSKDKIWCWYDSKAALRQWLWLQNDFNDKYNCVELVTHGIHRDSLYSQHGEYAVWFKWDLQRNIDEIMNFVLDWKIAELNWKAFPNDLLNSCFENQYMTTIFKK